MDFGFGFFVILGCSTHWPVADVLVVSVSFVIGLHAGASCGEDGFYVVLAYYPVVA